MKNKILLLTLLLSVFMSGCKKDALNVETEKHFIQEDFKVSPSNPEMGGWRLFLQPDGRADIVPGGDIAYRGTYKVRGKKLTVDTDGKVFEFEILSETRIKEKQYGIVLRYVDPAAI